MHGTQPVRPSAAHRIEKSQRFHAAARRTMTDREQWARDVLGLTQGATWDEVRIAFRDLTLVWHPDRFPGNARLAEMAVKKQQSINEAYSILRKVFEQPKSSPSAQKVETNAPPSAATRTDPPDRVSETPPNDDPPPEDESGIIQWLLDVVIEVVWAFVGTILSAIAFFIFVIGLPMIPCVLIIGLYGGKGSAGPPWYFFLPLLVLGLAPAMYAYSAPRFKKGGSFAIERFWGEVLRMVRRSRE